MQFDLIDGMANASKTDLCLMSAQTLPGPPQVGVWVPAVGRQGQVYMQIGRRMQAGADDMQG